MPGVVPGCTLSALGTSPNILRVCEPYLSRSAQGGREAFRFASDCGVLQPEEPTRRRESSTVEHKVFAVSYNERALWAMGDLEALERLPATFRYSDARQLMNERRFRDLVAHHQIVRLSRGLYRRADAPEPEELREIVAHRPRATLCLRSALARHDLIDDIPAALDIALPRGTRVPNTGIPVNWHHFDVNTFDIGRDLLPLDEGSSIGIYGPERSIIDAFRFREAEGPELGNEALRRWLRRGGQPSTLIRMAAPFRKGIPALRNALEVLL